ncbi:unnamed protein product [Chondrus crispus]|uniref:Uncharacterized protein n=1 Tax=Chondrus crispus TaxID=2769 RepID=R7Q783_CHOCR|nr:unnamed protein product [Chondrus crispus]CDF33683.1 unnamed protein product [Chondrus crispus]|eukprot:XP_005713502.1 unnamed protein product [Chondrus crispus]
MVDDYAPQLEEDEPLVDHTIPVETSNPTKAGSPEGSVNAHNTAAATAPVNEPVVPASSPVEVSATPAVPNPIVPPSSGAPIDAGATSEVEGVPVTTEPDIPAPAREASGDFAAIVGFLRGIGVIVPPHWTIEQVKDYAHANFADNHSRNLTAAIERHHRRGDPDDAPGLGAM